MSNHSGSYLLNEVLVELEKYDVFKYLGKKRTKKLLQKIVQRARGAHDCNTHEILEGIAQRLGFCMYCFKSITIGDEVCKDCQ